MLNLWIGLCKGMSGLPRSILDLSYTVHSVEPKVSTLPRQICNPEMIICSEAQRHSVLFEWKDGKNTDADQLRRYSTITSEHLQRMEFMSVNATKTFDVAIVGPSEHAERLKVGIVNGSYRFPLLTVDAKGITRTLNEFSCPKLNTIFQNTFAIDFARAPQNFIPFDGESDLWEVADVVIIKVLDRMLQKESYIKGMDLAALCCPIWNSLSTKGRQAIRAKVCEVLAEAAAAEFAGVFAHKEIANDCAVEFLDNPLDFEADKRSAAFRRMHKTLADLKARLVSGRKFERQLPLF